MLDSYHLNCNKITNCKLVVSYSLCDLQTGFPKQTVVVHAVYVLIIYLMLCVAIRSFSHTHILYLKTTQGSALVGMCCFLHRYATLML